jgi:hypothetical protein
MIPLDFTSDVYSTVLKIMNTICFLLLVVCFAYLAILLGLVHLDRIKDYKDKRAITVALGYIFGAIALHLLLLEYTGISLLVPPTDVPFFLEFMRYVQLAAFIGLAILVMIFFVTVTIKPFKRSMGEIAFVSFVCIIFLVCINWWLFEEFGVLLLQPLT